MTEFGEATVMQTTLASMFPISYATISLSMSPRTPQPQAPLAPEKVRGLMTTPISLTYTGFLKISDLNTELLFLARAICAATESVNGGVGVVGGQAWITNIAFIDVTVDDVTVPLVIQGLTLTGNLSFSGTLTSFGVVHIGYNSVSGNLSFASDVTIASLELYYCIINGIILLPSGSSLASILVAGSYSQISWSDLANKKIYPALNSLLYLNDVDGMTSRDVPAGARGFGAFTLAGLTQAVYPLVTVLALPDPWSVDIETLFPNLLSLYVIGYPKPGILTVPATSSSRYSSLTIIGASGATSIDINSRASSLTMGLRIVGCRQLAAVVLRPDPLATTPLREYRTLIVERCALLYLRGSRGMLRPPTTLRLGDHTSSLSMSSRSGNTTRLLDYVLHGMPTLGIGSTLPAVASDYLPNVLVSLAETLPSLVLYPVMQTVEYQFTRPAAVVAANPAGGLTSSYTQYSGGANPVVPSTGTSLTSAVITVSPFGVRYTLRVTPQSQPIGSTITGLSNSAVQGVSKGGLFGRTVSSSERDKWRTTMIIVIALGVALIVGTVIALVIIGITKRRAASALTRQKTREPNLKK